MNIEDHINKLKEAHQSFSEISSLTKDEVTALTIAAHHEWALDQRTELIQELRNAEKVERDAKPISPEQKRYLYYLYKELNINPPEGSEIDKLTLGKASEEIDRLKKLLEDKNRKPSKVADTTDTTTHKKKKEYVVKDW